MTLLDQTIQSTRTLTFEISPPVLYDLGLEPALQWLGRQFQKKHGLQAAVTSEGAGPTLPDSLQITVFRSVQEFLLNAVKHARASSVRIHLVKEAGWLRVEVADDGVGFVASADGSFQPDHGGFGLFSIRERLKVLGGALEISSSPGKGSSFDSFGARPRKRSRGGAAIMIRILIADDHKIIVDGLRSLLEKNGALKVVGQASDGLTAVRLAAAIAPDLVIMDISLPGLNGIDATRRILEANPRTKVIALSMHKDGRYIAEALKSGAAGYLLKESAFDELTAAIRTVMKGQAYLSASITDLVIKDYIHHLEKTASGVFSVLTRREREVLQSLSEGLSTKEIAARLRVSVKTVETYRAQIMEKLDIHSVAELTKYAIREGITSL